MAINIWQNLGRPTSYNPLPVGWTVKIDLEVGDYVLKFKAKSPTSATLGVKQDTQNIYLLNSPATTEFKEYEFNFKNTQKQPLYIRDGLGTGDIVVEDIVLVEKGYGKATINGLDGFGTVKEGFTGRLSALADFKNKIQGSTIENPHSAFTVLSSAWNPPSSMIGKWDWNTSQISYDQISTLNGVLKSINVATSGNRAHIQMSFNIIAEVEKQICQQIPASDLAGKVQWIKDNVLSIANKWYGYGSSPLGNKAWIAVWHSTSNAWTTGWNNHTASVVQGMTTNVNSNLQDRIDANGMIHFMAYADASDGAVNSTIHTDYTSIEIVMKQSSVVDSKWQLHPNTVLIDNETLELNATAKFQQSKIWIPVASGETYTYSIGEDVGTTGRFAGGWEDGNGVNISYTPEIKAGVLSQVLVPPAGAKVLRLSLDSTTDTAGKFIFKRPMLNLGSSPAPYESKRGDRMVKPTQTGKNLFNIKELVQTSWSVSALKKDYQLKPYTAYTLSSNVPQISGGSTSSIYFNGSITGANGVAEGKSVTMTTDATGVLYVAIPANPDRTYTQDLIKGNYWIQLEEGAVATPYEPYKVQMDRKPVKIPKGKNLIPSAWNKDWWEVSSAKYVALGDYKLQLNATLDHQYRRVNFKVKPNTVYTFSGNHNGVVGVYDTNGSTPLQAYTTKQSFTINSGDRTELRLYLSNLGLGIGTFTFENLQIEEGSVATDFEPQQPVNKTSIRQIKNLTPDVLEWTGNWTNPTGSTVTKNIDSVRVTVDTTKQSSSAFNHSNIPITIKVGKTYTLSYTSRANRDGVIPNYSYLMLGGAGGGNKSLTSPPAQTTEWSRHSMTVTCDNNTNNGYVMLGLGGNNGNANGDWIEFKDVQLEEGSIATPYESSKGIIKPIRKGLAFNGSKWSAFSSDSARRTYPIGTQVEMEGEVYLDVYNISSWDATLSFFSHQLPSTSKSAGFNIIFRPTYSLICYGDNTNTYKTIMNIPYIIPLYKWVKIRVVHDGQYFRIYENDVLVFTSGLIDNVYYDNKFTVGKWSDNYPEYVLTGIIKNAKLTINGEVVEDYDFSNPNTYIANNKVISKTGTTASLSGLLAPPIKLAKR